MSSARAWKCEVCGYIHQGDSPPDICPVCGVGSEMFSPFEIAPEGPQAPKARAWRCTVCGYVHEGDERPGRCPVCGVEKDLFEPFEQEPPASVSSDVERVVVLGAGIAGLTAVEHARQAAPDLDITLVSKERELPYYRLNLTRLLAREVDEASLMIHDEAWYAEQRIEVVFGEATSIDRDRREVLLEGGRRVPYDRLLLATGAHAFVPPIPGTRYEGVRSLRTLADAQAILRWASAADLCVCIGGGLLSLETAGALRRGGLQITVLEGAEWLLPRQLAQPAGQLLAEHVETLGIGVRCGVGLEEIAGDGRVRAVRLAGGEEIPADLVVVGTGIRPNSYLARQCGLDVDKGIIVDDHLFTSDPAILAAGDVAEHRGNLYGIWPAAFAQGAVAGTNAVGGKLKSQGMAPSNRLKVLDVELYSIGQAHPSDGSFHVFEHFEEGVYVRLVCRDGQLVGANLYGDTSLANAIAGAIENATPLVTCAEILDRLPQAVEVCR